MSGQEQTEWKKTAHQRRVDGVVCCVPRADLSQPDTISRLNAALYEVRDRNPFVVVTHVDSSAKLGLVRDEAERANLCVPRDRVFLGFAYPGSEPNFAIDQMTLQLAEAVVWWCWDAAEQREKRQPPHVATPQQQDCWLLFTDDEDNGNPVAGRTVEQLQEDFTAVGLPFALAECSADGVLTEPRRWVEHGPIGTHVRAVPITPP